jgi:hypothetical protein
MAMSHPRRLDITMATHHRRPAAHCIDRVCDERRDPTRPGPATIRTGVERNAVARLVPRMPAMASTVVTIRRGKGSGRLAYRLAGTAGLGPTGGGDGRWRQCRTGIGAGRLIGDRLDGAGSTEQASSMSASMPAQQLIEVLYNEA